MSPRVAVIDSGVNAVHPHIGRVAGGVTIGDPNEPNMYLDLLGHGTAVMAAIQEKAPDAEYFAVRVFCSSLRTRIEYLLRGIEWCIENGIDVINLSLGTPNQAHRTSFEPLIARATENKTLLVAALEANGVPALPGSLPDVVGVNLDWECPRETYRVSKDAEKTVIHASGYPRPLPGMTREQNLNGISFAVANATGFIVRDRLYETGFKVT